VRFIPEPPAASRLRRPTASAASSLLRPAAIRRQNNRSTSRRSDGLPGDFIGARPVNSVIHPAGLPIATLLHRALRRPIESAQYTSTDYTQVLDDHRVLASVGSVGDAYDNALAESFVDSFKTELIADRVWRTKAQVELAVVEYISWFNHDRLHEALGDIPPAEFEALAALRCRAMARCKDQKLQTQSPWNPVWPTTPGCAASLRPRTLTSYIENGRSQSSPCSVRPCLTASSPGFIEEAAAPCAVSGD
jgi:hypothetical protein